jgi:GTPase SAR1 family protein
VRQALNDERFERQREGADLHGELKDSMLVVKERVDTIVGVVNETNRGSEQLIQRMQRFRRDQIQENDKNVQRIVAQNKLIREAFKTLGFHQEELHVLDLNLKRERAERINRNLEQKEQERMQFVDSGSNSAQLKYDKQPAIGSVAAAGSSNSDALIPLKLCVLGKRRCGKSSLCIRFFVGPFWDRHIPSQLQTYRKDLWIDGRAYSVHATDTLGMGSEFLTRSWIEPAEGLLLCYSITDRQSFVDVQLLFDRFIVIKKERQQLLTTPVILLGNKKDLAASGQRAVSSAEGQALADKWGCDFLEVSAKAPSGVEESFFHILRRIANTKRRAKQALDERIIEKRFEQKFKPHYDRLARQLNEPAVRGNTPGAAAAAKTTRLFQSAPITRVGLQATRTSSSTSSGPNSLTVTSIETPAQQQQQQQPQQQPQQQQQPQRQSSALHSRLPPLMV